MFTFNLSLAFIGASTEIQKVDFHMGSACLYVCWVHLKPLRGYHGWMQCAIWYSVRPNSTRALCVPWPLCQRRNTHRDFSLWSNSLIQKPFLSPHQLLGAVTEPWWAGPLVHGERVRAHSSHNRENTHSSAEVSHAGGERPGGRTFLKMHVLA